MSDASKLVISVIIPCYNSGRFIRDAIESVLQQTFRDFEIIVVNDGSTDESTLEILTGLGDKYLALRLIHQENRGLAGARNAGIRVARGEFFLPLDSDDTIEPTMLEKCYRAIKGDAHFGFVYTSVRFFGDYEAVWHPREYNFYDLLDANQFTSCALVRKKAWGEVGGYDEKMREGYEDWEFWIRLGKKRWYGALIDEPLFNYRRHELSMTDDVREKHQIIFSYIKNKHKDLYTPEAQETIKSHWGSIAEKEERREKTIGGRISILRKKLKLAGVLSWRSWLKHPLRTFYRAIPIRWKTKGLFKIRPKFFK